MVLANCNYNLLNKWLTIHKYKYIGKGFEKLAPVFPQL